MRLRALPAALLLALLPAVARAGDGDEPPPGFEREVLLREAKGAGQPLAPTEVEPLWAALLRDEDFLAEARPQDDAERARLDLLRATVEERRLLVGDPPREGPEGEEIPATRGAIQEAHTLFRWLVGKPFEGEAGCGVVVSKGDKEGADGTAYSWPPRPEPTPPPAEGDAASAAPGGDAPPPAPADPIPAPAPSAPAGGEAAAPGGATPAAAPATPAAAPPAAPAAPPLPATLEAWAEDVRRQEGGSLLGRRMRAVACTAVPRLLEASQAPLRGFERTRFQGLGELRRFAVVDQDPFRYSAALVALRELQAAERGRAYAAEEPPPGLVDENTVREKARRAKQHQDRVVELRAELDRVTGELDAMAAGLDLWRFKAGEIEEQKRQLAEAARGAAAPPPEGTAPGGETEPADAGDAEPDLASRLLAAQETLVTLEMRLLFAAALRAKERIDLLQRLMAAAEVEATAADSALKSFRREFDRVRRARQLDRLVSENRRLTRLRAWAEGREGERWSARLAAIDATIHVNELAREAVRYQRSLLQRVAPPRDEKAPSGGAAAATPSGTEVGEGSTADPLLLFRRPADAPWDEAWIREARRLLPTFPAALVVEHHDAAWARIRAWETTLGDLPSPVRLKEGFEQATTRARSMFEALGDDYTVRTQRLDQVVQGDGADFTDAVDGLEAEAARLRTRLDLARAYREELLEQGPRSFGIRVQSVLRGEDLIAALKDTTSGLERAGDWLTLEQKDRNALEFARSRWLDLLLVLGGALVGVLLVRWMRRRLDRWLERRAARIPGLRWSGASVAEERALARERKEMEEAAARAKEDAVLRQARQGSSTPTPEEAVPAAPAAEGEAAGAAPTPAADEDGPPKPVAAPAPPPKGGA